MNNRTDLSTATPLSVPRPFPKPVVEVEKPHPTVSDSFGEDETGPLLQVRTGDIWSDFIRVEPEERNPDAVPRNDGTMPLLDDMIGIRQWE